jgi:thiamine phosphate synthase YjbQ (UPF0047 family)
VAKRIRPAKHYQRSNDAALTLMKAAKPGITRDLREALRHLRDLVPKDMKPEHHRTAIKWDHFGEVLKKPFAKIGKAY